MELVVDTEKQDLLIGEFRRRAHSLKIMARSEVKKQFSIERVVGACYSSVNGNLYKINL